MNNHKTLCKDENKINHTKIRNAQSLKFILHKMEANMA